MTTAVEKQVTLEGEVVGEIPLCPLYKLRCLQDRCMWYNRANKHCAVVDIAVILRGIRHVVKHEYWAKREY